jgi:Ca2+-transporting ATPase
VLLGTALQLAVIYIPFLNDIMKTQPLSATELAFCILVPGLVLVALEGEKWLVRRGVIHRGQPRAPLAGR